MTINTVKGFTLVEILIVVAIIAIIASIAVPSYQDSVKKTRRTDGKEALLNAAALQEKIYLQKNAYSADVKDLGGGTSKKGYYTISIAQAEGATNTYALTATATGAQASDSKCAKLTLSHTGLQEAFAADGTKSEVCW